MFGQIMGYRIIEVEMCGDPRDRFRFRTWRERLFTLPWQPLRKMEFYKIYVPNGNVIIDQINYVIYAHPLDISKLRQELLP